MKQFYFLIGTAAYGSQCYGENIPKAQVTLLMENGIHGKGTGTKFSSDSYFGTSGFPVERQVSGDCKAKKTQEDLGKAKEMGGCKSDRTGHIQAAGNVG